MEVEIKKRTEELTPKHAIVAIWKQKQIIDPRDRS
jgi:hypothetical protein